MLGGLLGSGFVLEGFVLTASKARSRRWGFLRARFDRRNGGRQWWISTRREGGGQEGYISSPGRFEKIGEEKRIKGHLKIKCSKSQNCDKLYITMFSGRMGTSLSLLYSCAFCLRRIFIFFRDSWPKTLSGHQNGYLAHGTFRPQDFFGSSQITLMLPKY